MRELLSWWRKRRLTRAVLTSAGGSRGVRPRMNSKEKELMARLILAEFAYVLDQEKSKEERAEAVKIAFEAYRDVRDKRVPPQLVRVTDKSGQLAWARQRIGIPAGPQFLMYLFLNRADRNAIPGDLDEEFQQTIVPKFGRRKAYIWYWSQAISAVLYRNALCRCIWGIVGIWKLVEWVNRKLGG